MLKNILLSIFLTNIVYMGYEKSFTNAKMFWDLLGIRKNISLHNLNTTYLSFQKILNLLSGVWLKFGVLWVIAPNTVSIINYFYPYRKCYYLESLLHFWLTKWRYGVVTNMKQFSLLSTKLLYPTALLYFNYTSNFMKLIEGERAGLLQLGVADSNSSRYYYNYYINANEKSSRSYLFFLHIVTQLAVRSLTNNKKSLLF